MKRLISYGIGLAIGAVAPPGAAWAQEADDREAVARQAPVFDLQPGETREQPQPDVQGPRAPGMPAPRLLGEDEEPPPQTVTRPAPVPTQVDPVPVPGQQTEAATDAERPPAAPATTGQTATPALETEAQAAPDTPTAETAETATPQPQDRPDVVQEPVATPAAEDGLPWWIWLVGALGLAAIGAAVMAAQKRGRERAEEAPAFEPLVAKKPVSRGPVADDETEGGSTPLPAVTPAPPAKGPPTALPPASAPPPAPTEEERPSRIEIDFVPLTARLSTLGLTLAYRLVLTNVSDETLSDIAVRLGIRSGDHAAMEVTPNAGEACVSLDTLAPGKTHTHSAQIRLDPKTYKPVQSDGKAMLVPIVDMLPRYRDADGVLHEMHATMLVGRELEPPRPKMQPFWLERGFGQFRGIGCRMLNVRTI